MIYLDYAATTPVDPQVIQAMLKCLGKDGVFANASSITHALGSQAGQVIEEARAQVAQAIGAESAEIIFTSGATESNNLALKGIAHFHRARGSHLITVSTEHRAILDVCAQLEREGFDITYLSVNEQGLIDLSELKTAIRKETILISCMLVNNETGVIQPLKDIIEIAHEQGVYVHSDAAQAFGKYAFNIRELNIDLLSLSAHKAYGPKGVGALYIRRQPRVRLQAQQQGGGQEQGMRAGTLPTHQIVGMGAAFQSMEKNLAQDLAHYQNLENVFVEGISSIPGTVIHSQQAPHVGSIFNVSFSHIDNSALLVMLSHLALATGSACSSGSTEPSHVLRAMKVPADLLRGNLRFSFGRYTTLGEIQEAVEGLKKAVVKLHRIAGVLCE